MSKKKEFQQNVTALLRARNSLIWVVSREELRAERAVVEAAGAAGYECELWDCAGGLVGVSGDTIDNYCKDPAAILDLVKNQTSRRVYILRDFNVWLRDPTVSRGIKTLARELQSAPKNESRALVILANSADVSPDLVGAVSVVELPLPDREEMESILQAVIESQPEELRGSLCSNGERAAVVDSALGLSSTEAESAIYRSLVLSSNIEPGLILAEKKLQVKNVAGVEWVDPDIRGLAGVGGLDLAKQWLISRQAAFSPKARAYGLPAPKGVLLVGVQGCGKSLLAKTVAAAWGQPLLRLDMGAAKSKWVGDSEKQIRGALKMAGLLAPCVLWIDEIEKSAAGAVGQSADGNVSSDSVGAILTWLQDRTEPVFVVATANNIEILPPELLRKGRFDEIFFIDLPTYEERVEILKSALGQYNQSTKIGLNSVATATDGFSGAELSALVPDAMFAAFADNERLITTADLVGCAGATIPLSKTASEKITRLRQWAQGRARPATTQTIKSAAGVGRDLDI